MCPVRSAAWQARRTNCSPKLRVCPPKRRWLMRFSDVRSKGKPMCSSSMTASTAFSARIFAACLIGQVIAALDRVIGVIDRLVLVEVAQRRADAALRRAGMAAGRVELADHRDISAALAGIQRRHQTSAARADDNHIVLMNLHAALARRAIRSSPLLVLTQIRFQGGRQLFAAKFINLRRRRHRLVDDVFLQRHE